jgi:hypothetical protein
MKFSIERWDYPNRQWVHNWTVNAESQPHALRLARLTGFACRIRAVPIADGPDAGIAPLSLPFKPTSDPTFYRPKGYHRPPSPAARRKHRNPR